MDSSRRRVIAAACLGCRPVAGMAGITGAGAVEADISDLAEEELRAVEWNGRRVWILRRSPAMLRQLQSPQLLSRLADPSSSEEPAGRTPAYARNALRSIKAEVFVGIAICPHAGCVPVARLKPGPHPDRADNWPGGFACPCHFATFDLAGRVFKDKPTGLNLEVPPHLYVAKGTLLIGQDTQAKNPLRRSLAFDRLTREA
jgi:ubiquinol-cytochrome c reductase iron-sulfur subunit